MWSVNEKAPLYLAHFDAKQSRDSLQQLHYCNPFQYRVLLPSGQVLFVVCFWIYWNVSTFLQAGGSKADRNLDVSFRPLVKMSSFPAFWRLADVVPVSKESSSLDAADYRPISFTPVLSNVYEKIAAGRRSYIIGR